MHADGLEALVEAADEVEDESAVSDGLSEVAEHVRHALHLLAVISDGLITLDVGAELGVEEGTRFAIVEELGLHSTPRVAGGGVLGGDRLGEVVADGAEKP
jgi:hypothetical protein